MKTRRPLTSYKHPHHLVAALVLSGRHGHTGNPDATLGWAMDRAREHEEKEDAGNGCCFSSPETDADPRAMARIRWHEYQRHDLGIRDPTEPHRFSRAELWEYLDVAWPEVFTDHKRRRLMFEFEGKGKEVVLDLVGENPTGYWLADDVDDACAAELERALGGSQTSLF